MIQNWRCFISEPKLLTKKTSNQVTSFLQLFLSFFKFLYLSIQKLLYILRKQETNLISLILYSVIPVYEKWLEIVEGNKSFV